MSEIVTNSIICVLCTKCISGRVRLSIRPHLFVSRTTTSCCTVAKGQCLITGTTWVLARWARTSLKPRYRGEVEAKHVIFRDADLKTAIPISQHPLAGWALSYLTMLFQRRNKWYVHEWQGYGRMRTWLI